MIVTTERRATNVQDTPLAVTAYTDKTRENLGIESIQSLAQFSPGVSYSAAADRPTIRGVGRQNNSHGLNSPVANYIDGFYVSTTQDTARRPIFVDRNEVVSRSAGRLGRHRFGRRRHRHLPQASEGRVRGRYRQPASRTMNAGAWKSTVTGPITDWLRYRVNAARYKQQEGFYRNEEDGRTEGDRFGNRTLFDLMFSGNVGKNIDWFLKGSTTSYYESLHDGGTFAPLSTGVTNPCIQTPFASTASLVPAASWGVFSPGNQTSCGAFASGFSAVTGIAPSASPTATIFGAGIAQNPAFTNGAGARRDFISNYHSDLHLENYHLISFDTTYHAPIMDVKYIVGSSRYHYTQSSDNDGSPVTSMFLPATSAGTAARQVDASGINIYQEEPSWYSNELTFTSTWKGPLQGIVGLYQYNQYTRQPTADIVYEGLPELATELRAGPDQRGRSSSAPKARPTLGPHGSSSATNRPARTPGRPSPSGTISSATNGA